MKKTSLFALLGTFLMIMVVLPISIPTQADQPTAGCIYGYTYQHVGWSIYPVAFVLVTAGTEYDYSDLTGFYEITNLQLDQVYEVRAAKAGYENISIQVELTAEQPIVEVDFILAFHPVIVEQQNTCGYILTSNLSFALTGLFLDKAITRAF